MRDIAKKNKDRAEKKTLSMSRAGFTLVEMMVSVAIFTLSMGVVAQIFFYSMHIQRFLVAHSQLVNEMSYNLEHISRGLRMAKKSTATSPVCLSSPGINFEPIPGVGGIKFLSPKPGSTDGSTECVKYYLSGQTLMEDRNGLALPMTSPDVKIFKFTIAGAGWGQEDDLQPRVTVYIKAESEEKEIMENQITISQRDIDVIEWQ